MNIEDAIREQYGTKIPIIPSDFKLRKFKIDCLRNGFVMKDVEYGVFGSIIDGESFIFDGLITIFQKLEHKDNKSIRCEWLIWEAARSMLERGEKMDRADSERLELAVKNLEGWL